MFFDLDECLNEGMFLSFVTSERGAGKTFSTLKRLIERFIETKEQFVYMRRSQTELEECIPTFFDAHYKEGFFADVKLTVKGDFLMCNGEIMGRCMAVSTAYKYKSVGFPNVKVIMFDEFISENKRYLKDECFKFLSAIETIGRMREIRVVCLANQSSIYNPYYVYFKIRPHSATTPKTRFRDRSILIYQFTSAAYKEAKKETTFGKLIAGTSYGDFMLDNKNIQDDYSFVDELKGWEKRPFLNMLIDGVNIVCYDAYYKNEYRIYMQIKDVVDNVTSLNFDKQLAEDRCIERVKNNRYSKRVSVYLSRGMVSFKDVRCKNIIESFIF